MRKLPLALPSILGMILSFGLLSMCTALLMRDLGWWGVAAAVAAMGVGRWVRNRFITQPRLVKAEQDWASGLSASAVLDEIPIAGGGEGARHIHLLRARAALSLGYRDLAWASYREADLARMAWPLRALVRPLFKSLPEAPSNLRMRMVSAFLWILPRSPRLHHLKGLLHLRRNEPGVAWDHFKAALPLAGEDALLLDDLMRAGFSLGQEELGEHALALLMGRHGDPRIQWDRPAALHYLLMKGRMLDGLALARPVPAEHRHHPLHWLGESVPLRALGNLDAAWTVLDAGTQRLPKAFPLWMERAKLAMDLHRDEDALAALEQAQQNLPDDLGARQEWALRRAEAAWWIEEDAEAAWNLLQEVPNTFHAGPHPPLRLQLLVALGRHAEAIEDVKAQLVDKPKDPELLLLQADCMAGMEAWPDLLPFLDTLPLRCREQATYWHLRGLALAHRQDHLGARMELERAARMDPRRIRHLLDAGHACAELGEWARAEAHWRQALELEPDSEEALIQISDARRELHDMEGSRRYLRECLVHYPDSADAQDRLAELEAN